MRVQLLFFAALKERVGDSERELVLPASVENISQLRTHLEREVPKLAGRLGSVRFAVNEQFAEASHVLSDGDVIALIPPVSGG